jgi:DNA-binding response OmpR family regulator
MTPRVLIVEDDPDIALSLRYCLEREGGFRVTVAPDGERGLREARHDPPHLVLLDLALPGLDGMEVCRALRTTPETANVPIIMLTARVEERNKIAGLERGADDYVTKPFSLRELLARVRALLRRSQGGTDDPPRPLVNGPVSVDEARRRVHVADREITLTRKEFDLLAELVRRPGLVLTREQLLERVWGYDHPGETRTVDVHIRQLRKKLGAPAAEAIETVVGVGYRLRSLP